MVDIFEMRKGGFRAAKGFKKSEDDKFMTREEFESLLDVARGDKRKYGTDAYDLFAIAGNFGLRCSEAIDLERDDFRTISMGYFRVRTLKKRAEIEDRVYVGRTGIEFLREIVERRSKGRTDKLFPFCSRTARYLFAFYGREAGLSRNVSFHSLRHTAARLLLEAVRNSEYAVMGMNIVKAFLRHTPTPTEIYTRPTPEVMMKAMDLKGVIR